MHYPAPAVNTAGLTCWLAGTATSAASGLMAWADPATAADPATVQRVQQGGMGLAVIGLLTLLVNFLGNFTTQWFKDRKDARDERRDIRERDAKVAALETELHDARERWHEKAKADNARMLELQEQVVKNTAGLKVTAEASGVNLPTGDFPTLPGPA